MSVQVVDYWAKLIDQLKFKKGTRFAKAKISFLNDHSEKVINENFFEKVTNFFSTQQLARNLIS